MAKLFIDVDINGANKVKDLDSSVSKLDTTSKKTTKSTNELSRSLRNLATAAGAYVVVTKLNDSLKAIIETGFEFNSLMESQVQGLTALTAVTSANIDSFGKSITVTEKYAMATKDATLTMSELLRINAKTPHTLGETSQIYKAMYVSMKNLGVTSEELVTITEKLSIAAGAGQIEFNSLLAGVDGLATGTVMANSDLGRFLSAIGLTNEALRDTTNIVGLLDDKLGQFESIENMTTIVSNLTNEWNQLASVLTKDIFEVQKENLKNLSSELSNYSSQVHAFFMQFRDSKDVHGIEDINLKLLQLNRDLAAEQERSTTFMWNSDKKIRQERIDSILEEIALLEKRKNEEKRASLTSVEWKKDEEAASLALYEIDKYSREMAKKFRDQEIKDAEAQADMDLAHHLEQVKQIEKKARIKQKAEDDAHKAWIADAEAQGEMDLAKHYEQMRAIEEKARAEEKARKKQQQEERQLRQEELEFQQQQQRRIGEQATAYSMLAGAMVGAFEEGSQAAENMKKVQVALSIVSGVNAILTQGEGDPYSAFARMAAMAVSVATTLSSGGVSNSLGSGVSQSQEFEESQTSKFKSSAKAIEKANKPVLDRLDRQIELLESIGGFGGVEIEASLDKALLKMSTDFESTIASSMGQIIGDVNMRMSTDNPLYWQVFNSREAHMSARFEQMLGEYSKAIDFEVKFEKMRATEQALTSLNEEYFKTASNLVDFMDYLRDANLAEEFGLTEQEYDSIINDFQQVNHDFTKSLLSDMQILTGFADNLESAFDVLSGTDTYQTEHLKEAFRDINNLIGSENLSDYISNQAEAIRTLEATLNEADIALLLSTSVEDFTAQQELINTISDETRDVLEAGAKEALNYKDSLLLVSEAMASSNENIKTWEDNFKTQEELLTEMFEGKTYRKAVESTQTAKRLVGDTWEDFDLIITTYESAQLEVAKNLEELDTLFQILKDDTEGLTNADLELLEANKAFLESLEDITEETKDSLLLVSEAMASSNENIKTWEDSFKTQEELLRDVANAIDADVAENLSELDSMFVQLSTDADGLTDAELDLLEANKAFLESLEDIAEETIEADSAVSDFLKSVKDEILDIEKIVDSLSSAIETLQGATTTSESSMNLFYASMKKTLDLSTKGDNEAIAESLSDTITASKVLLDSANFKTAAEQRFAQATAIRQFESIQVDAVKEIDYLKTISENTENLDELILNGVDATVKMENESIFKDFIEKNMIIDINDEWGDVNQAMENGFNWNINEYPETVFDWNKQEEPRDKIFDWNLRSEPADKSFDWDLRSEPENKSFDWNLRDRPDTVFDWNKENEPLDKFFNWDKDNEPEKKSFNWNIKEEPVEKFYNWNKAGEPDVKVFDWNLTNEPNVAFDWNLINEPSDKIFDWNINNEPSDKIFDWNELNEPVAKIFDWNLTNEPADKVFNWNMTDEPEQKVFEWDLSSEPTDKVFDWGLNNEPADKSFDWNLDNEPENKIFNWNLTNEPSQQVFDWNISNKPEQQVFDWNQDKLGDAVIKIDDSSFIKSITELNSSFIRYSDSINDEYYGSSYPSAFGFSSGGYTPKGEKNTPAGVVHAGEWVAPKWMVNSNQELFRSLESARQNSGFSSGGVVASQIAVSAPTNQRETNQYLFVVADELKRMNRLFKNISKGGTSLDVQLVG